MRKAKKRSGGRRNGPTPELDTSASEEERLNRISYQVAEKWVSYVRPREIAADLSLGDGPKGHAAVKRHVERARKKGFLVLVPPAVEHLSKALAQRFSRTTFHVVDDPPADEKSIFRRAAIVLATEINQILHRSAKPEIFVGIPGGHALLETVESLRYETTALREEARSLRSERLRFVSLNAAADAQHFQKSANYITVALAGIYEAQHLCTLPNAVEGSLPEYQAAVKDIDLLVTSVASNESPSFFGDWLRREFPGEFSNQQGQTVGDVAFIPVDAEGRPSEYPPLVRQRIEEVFRPRPTYVELQTIALEKRVLLILRALSRDPARERVVRGILERQFASACVLGAEFARAIVR